MDTQGPTFRTTNALIERLPDPNLAKTLKALGLWTVHAHESSFTRPTFVKDMAGLASHDLANEQAKWTSEAGRITELHGLLVAQKVRTDFGVKIAQAKARATVRAKHEKNHEGDKPAKKLTAAEVNDLSEEEQVLIDAREQALLVETTLATLAATKEATLLYLSTLSREITRRGDLNRVYGN